MRQSCFGVPSIFSFTNKTCAECADRKDCQRTAHSALKGAPSHIVRGLLIAHDRYAQDEAVLPPQALNLDTTNHAPTQPKVKAKAVRYALTKEQQEIIDSAPKAVGSFLKKLFVRHEHEVILNAAREGKNAFSKDKQRPYHLAMEMIIQSGFTRPVLRLAYREQLGWSEASAKTQASVTWKVLIALGIAEENGTGLVATSGVRAFSRNIRYQ